MLPGITIAIEIILFSFQVILSILVAVVRFIIPKTAQPLVNKTVLITGAAQGIGKELARQYGANGCKILCVDINLEKNQKTVEQLRRKGTEAFSYRCDITNQQEVARLAETVKKERGTIDILVNNAGICASKKFAEHTEQNILNLFNVNIISHFWILKEFLPDMGKRGGHVVAVSSASGLGGRADYSAYAATKFAVRGLMKSLKQECRRDGLNVQFTTVCPFFVDTDMLLQADPAQKLRSSHYINMLILSPEDVAKETIKAQRQGIEELSIPRIFKPGLALLELLPESAQTAFWDFFDSQCGK